MTLCATALLATPNLFAQGPHNGPDRQRPSAEQRAKYKTERTTQELNLTDAQSKDVYSAYLAAEQETDAQIERMKASREAQDTKMKQILTPEQYEKWKKTANQVPQRGMRPGENKPGERPNGRPGNGRPQQRNSSRMNN